MGDVSGMRVALTGASGFVGRHVAAALTGAGCHVNALVRSTDKAARTLPDENVRLTIGDVFDEPILDDLVHGCDALVHTIGIIRELPPDTTFRRLHVLATKRVTEAAARARVERYVHVSALGTRADAPSAYHRSKHESEQIVRRSSLDWTILRPSLIHGHDSGFVQMTRDWVLGRAAPRVFLPWFAKIELKRNGGPPRPALESARVMPVHIDDVARAVLECLRRDQSIGEVYPLVGPDEMTWPDVLVAVRDAMTITDRSKKPLPVPGYAGYAAAKAASVLGLGPALPFGDSEPLMSLEDQVASPEKAATHLGIEPTPFADALDAYAEQI